MGVGLAASVACVINLRVDSLSVAFDSCARLLPLYAVPIMRCFVVLVLFDLTLLCGWRATHELTVTTPAFGNGLAC